MHIRQAVADRGALLGRVVLDELGTLSPVMAPDFEGILLNADHFGNFGGAKKFGWG